MDDDFINGCRDISGKIVNNKCITIVGGKEREVPREQVKIIRINVCKNRNFECLGRDLYNKHLQEGLTTQEFISYAMKSFKDIKETNRKCEL